MKRTVFFIMTVMILLSCFNMCIFSHVVPDIGRIGSITVTMRYGGSNVPGGSMTIYRVGDIKENNGNYSFELSGSFAQVNADLTDIESDVPAFAIAAHIAENDIMGNSMPIDKNGKVTFYDLETGLYMLIQDTAATGYNCANPILVSLPMLNDGEYIYDVDASAKVELFRDNNDPHNDTTADTGKYPSTTRPGQSSLPQTGQLNWPIPILAVAGTAFVLIGMILCFGNRKVSNED